MAVGVGKDDTGQKGSSGSCAKMVCAMFGDTRTGLIKAQQLPS